MLSGPITNGSVLPTATISRPGCTPSKGSSKATAWAVSTADVLNAPNVTFGAPIMFSGGEFLSAPGEKIAMKPVPGAHVPVWNPVQHGTCVPEPVQATPAGN